MRIFMEPYGNRQDDCQLDDFRYSHMTSIIKNLFCLSTCAFFHRSGLCLFDCLFVPVRLGILVECLIYEIREIAVISDLVLIDIEIVHEMYLVVDQASPIVFVELDILYS